MTVLVLLAALYTNTAQVHGLAAQGSTLWAATAGGVEQYDLTTGRRLRLYTTEDGLDVSAAEQIWIAQGTVHARTAFSDCALSSGSFACSPAPPLAAAIPAVAPLFHGARVTARLEAAGKSLVATAGRGLWSNDQMLTPEGQVCGNHLEALAEFAGQLWAGAFDGGLCVQRADGGFRTVPAPFRMVNDLRATPRGLFVTTPAVLYAVRLDGRDLVRRFRHPAGSTALQAVAVSGGNVWLASEDVGVIRMQQEKFEAFDRASGLPSSWTVDVAAAPGGGVWAATLRNGAVRLDADGSVQELGGDAKAWGLRLYDDGGCLLFGTQQGLVQAERSSTGSARRLPDSRVHALLRTRDGLWVGTEGGLALLDRGCQDRAARRSPTR